jgi:hypothetical protein
LGVTLRPRRKFSWRDGGCGIVELSLIAALALPLARESTRREIEGSDPNAR